MQCPKCHNQIKEGQTVCPKCHKVLQLECPNCKTLGTDSVCSNCGYTILVKCSKCGKKVPTTKTNCNCGFKTSMSLAYQECESDSFASIIVNFNSLKTIKKLLKSQDLYTKFFFKLKNLLFAQIKGIDCKFIIYDNTFVINLNKELSFATSSHKAVKLALKIANAFTDLNLNVINEFGVSLNLTLNIVEKLAENLQELTIYQNNVKPLTIKKNQKKHLKGTQIILDQYVCDQINKEFKTDSLYSQEENGKTTIFYEILLEHYILPPKASSEEPTLKPTQKILNKNQVEAEKKEDDLYSFKVFDIKAKCSFKKTSTTEIFESLSNLDLTKNGKIISLKTTSENKPATSDLVDFYKSYDYKVLFVTCTEELSYKPWGLLQALFKEYFILPYHNRFIDLAQINPNSLKIFKPLFDLILGTPTKAMSPEDARFTYMELWNKFLSILNNTVIIIDGFENIDDTSLQTLELYFDKFKTIKPNFLLITQKDISAHSKIKGLLRTPFYTEFTLQKSSIENCLSTLKLDASDFIQSFYFEKIKENFDGSYLYFKNAIEYLKDTGILLDFENKLLIQNKKSVILPKDLQSLYKVRMKSLSKNIDLSFILAYSSILNERIDLKTFSALGIKDIDTNIKCLIDTNFARLEENILYINNYNLTSPIITSSLKQEAENFLVKNIIAQLGKGLDDTTMAIILGKMGLFKDEYLNLWKNAQFAIKTGDYDSYLKSCLGFLSLIEHIESNVSKEEIEENKKEVYKNILMSLYSYSPSKIYFIENILLMDAIKNGDDEKIVKLSNLMLQGALITYNYKEALGLLHNILSRMPQATLKINNEINIKFLLLSLVNIEILYNIGDFKQCIEIANDILSVLSQETIETIKPASFSTNLFVTHLLETLRLVGFAKLYVMDDDLDDFFNKIKTTLNTELPEKDCILAIKDYLAGKVYNTGNIEEYSAFSKIIFVILQEFSLLKNDYKRFAQNIYQAKLLASDIQQKETEMFCDLLIGYAYSKIGINEKAEIIYRDVLENAKKSAMFNISTLARYLLAKLIVSTEEALILINDTLAVIKKQDNQSKIMYALFEKLYIDILKTQEITSIDIKSEEQNLLELKEPLANILK